MKDILISIIIPAYNCEEYIVEGANSVLTGLPDNCELIIVDDGSTDGTRDVLKTLQCDQGRLRILYNEHKGASGARNAGLDIAQGRYVTFLDCDDCLREGFIKTAVSCIDSEADLYIFGIERIPLEGERAAWTVKDQVYPDASSFADDYIRTRKLLIYSNCNKLYRRSIIEKLNLRFVEGMEFGEDRLFNYGFLMDCGKIVTSSEIMLEYIQRTLTSMSTRYIAGYFELARELHRAKMECFLNLSHGTTEIEKLDFEASDLSNVIDGTINRFKDHPKEQEENLPLINRLIFGEPRDMDEPVDIIIVLGSLSCEYRIEQAVEIGRKNPGVRYIVSGGKAKANLAITEAEFMADYLRKADIPDEYIYIENKATNTIENLQYSAQILQEIREKDTASNHDHTGVKKTGIITGGFHIPRTELDVKILDVFGNESICFFPAFGLSTRLDNWYCTDFGKKVVLDEFQKYVFIKIGLDHGEINHIYKKWDK